MTAFSENSGRVIGRVSSIRSDLRCGWIASDDHPDQSFYFKLAWYRGVPPLQEGDTVTFEIVTYNDKLQAHNIARFGTGETDKPAQPAQADLRPTTGRLLDWAYLGYIPEALGQLASLALRERWEFKNHPRDAERPFPILYSYLLHTFGRLAHEQKIIMCDSEAFAAFNTGLVDRRYEPVYAVFARQQNPKTPWKLSSFCVAGEEWDGQTLVRYFNPLPRSAHYFDDPSVLLYDKRAGNPELAWKHVVIENVSRFPREFLEDNCPRGFMFQDTSNMAEGERRNYYARLGMAIESDDRTYRAIINRFKDALDLSIKRVSWNFKTAIPQYYPKVMQLTLLLPICLIHDDQVDLALAVEKTQSGNYLGHTILPLDWAYKNARLICRPDSDWLTPDEIAEEIEDQGEE